MPKLTETTGAASGSDVLTEEEVAILAIINRGGIEITEHEPRHQMARWKIERFGLLERMIDLEERGMIESRVCFRVTQQGLEQLPDNHHQPRIAGYRSEWRCPED